MRILCRGLVGVSAVFLCLVVAHAPLSNAAPDAPATDGKVALVDLKYDELTQLVRANKGKVIVVDFWGEY